MLMKHQHYQNSPCFNPQYMSIPCSLNGKQIQISYALLLLVLMDDGIPTVKTDCPLANNSYMLINIHIIMSTSAGHWHRPIGGEPIAVVCRIWNSGLYLLYRNTQSNCIPLPEVSAKEQANKLWDKRGLLAIFKYCVERKHPRCWLPAYLQINVFLRHWHRITSLKKIGPFYLKRGYILQLVRSALFC